MGPSPIPTRSTFAALLALALGAPLLSHASGNVVGAYSMFGHLERYHIDVLVSGGTEGGTAERRVSLRSLAPHLSRDARQMLMPADSHALGADQVRLVAAELPALARLSCAVHAGARSVRVRMERRPVRSDVVTVEEARIFCQAVP